MSGVHFPTSGFRICVVGSGGLCRTMSLRKSCRFASGVEVEVVVCTASCVHPTTGVLTCSRQVATCRAHLGASPHGHWISFCSFHEKRIPRSTSVTRVRLVMTVRLEGNNHPCADYAWGTAKLYGMAVDSAKKPSDPPTTIHLLVLLVQFERLWLCHPNFTGICKFRDALCSRSLTVQRSHR